MIFALLASLLLSQSVTRESAPPGIKLTTRYSSNGGFASEQTRYYLGDRRRTEFRNASAGSQKQDGTMQVNYGPPLVSIQRCDLGQAFELNLQDREYAVAPFPPKPLTPEQRRARGLPTELHYLSDKPTIKVEITTIDTSERKDFFGHKARHIITTRQETPLKDSQAQPSETVTDGWYIDLNTRISCDRPVPSGRHAYSYLAAGDKPMERPTFVRHGEAETGFPIELKSTTRTTTVLPDGARKELTYRNDVLVTEFEERPLDPALFEVPSAFRKVDAIRRNPVPSLSGWAGIKQWFRNWLR